MIDKISNAIYLSPEVAKAMRFHQPVVALESTVITHGLPYPENLQLATDLESEINKQKAVPATIALLKGKVQVGLSNAQKEELIHAPFIRKVSRRDFGISIARQEFGGTTVAGTLIVAHKVGIRVFATGGIGGVHREPPFDVSADLPELSRSRVVVVCAGAKAILDLPATVEYLETMGIPIVGYQTDEFPAFYSHSSGLSVGVSVSSPEEVAQIAKAHWEMGLSNAVLVVTPPPENSALPSKEVEQYIKTALKDAIQKNIAGSAMTPFLLQRISELSHGASLKVNLDLLRNNAKIAAQISLAMQSDPTKRYA